MMKTESLELVTLQGELIHLEYPEEDGEGIYDDLMLAFNSQTIWYCGNWCNLQISFRGCALDYIDTHKLIGILC